MQVLKESLALQAGEVIDATRLNVAALCAFFEKEIQDCFDKKLMMSLHMKATMMKVSDPIIFGHCIKVCMLCLFLALSIWILSGTNSLTPTSLTCSKYYVSKISIFGLRMMVKSGLQKMFFEPCARHFSENKIQ